MKFFIYCRKSSDREDKQVLSTEAQMRLLAEYAEKHRLAVAGTYVENQSAYKAGRPMFNEMLHRIEKGDAEAVLTYHLTRLARNSFDGGRIIYMMDEKRIAEIATPEKAYVNSADDKFMMQIHFAMAKKSSDDTSEFVRRDVETKLLRGEYPGWAPVGYLNITSSGHIARTQSDPQKYMLLMDLGRPLKRVEIDPIDGPLVRRLFEEAAKGHRSLSQLRKMSYGLGLRSRRAEKMLSKSMIDSMLKNPFYYGAIQYRGQLFDTVLIRERSGNPEAKIQHEPLVPRDLFDRVQLVMSGKAKGRYRKHQFSFGQALLRCGECGGPITAEMQRANVYYHCTRNNGPCDQNVWTREDVLEKQLCRVLSQLILPPAYLDYSLEKIRSVHALQAKFSHALRLKIQSRLNESQRKLDALLQLKISAANADGSMLSDEEYLAQKLMIRRELEMLQEQHQSMQQEDETWVDDCEQFFRFTQQLTRKFAEADIDAKKSYLLLVCSNIALKDQEVAAVYREPYASLAKFPLAGKQGKPEFEQGFALAAAKKSDFAENWYHLVDAIRTYRLPFWLQDKHLT